MQAAAAPVQYLRPWTCTVQTWVQLLLASIGVTGGHWKGIQSILLLCTVLHILVDTSKPLIIGVSDVKFRCLLHLIIN